MHDDRLADGTIFQSYKIEGLIATGGMGQVYRARHRVFKEVVALKVLHSSLHADPEWRTRFDWEGNVGEQLKHPYVLAARERIHARNHIALVLDMVPEGQTLERIISRDYPNGLDPDLAMDVFLKVLSGMRYLHERDIVHGDIKPENVLIRGNWREPWDWHPLVTDFGTVALIAKPVNIDGRPAVVATPRYASPEHLCGVDHIVVRSDIYCLGLLLHYLLSGRHASNAQNVFEAADRVQMPVPVLNLTDKVPGELIDVFRRMVAMDPADRYESVLAVAMDIRAIRDQDGSRSEEDNLDAAPDCITEQDERVPAIVEDRRGYSEMPTASAPDRGPRVARPTRERDAGSEQGPPTRSPQPLSEAARTGAPPEWPRQRTRLSTAIGWVVGLVLLIVVIAVAGRSLLPGG